MSNQLDILTIISTILTTPLGYIYVLMFIDKFRYAKKTTAMIIAVCFTFMIADNLIIFYVLGITAEAKIIIAAANILICFILTFILAEYQKGYLWFLYLNASVFVYLSNIISGIFGPTSSPIYLLTKLAAESVILLFLHYFFKPIFFEIKNQSQKNWHLLSLFPLSTFVVFSLMVLKLGLFEDNPIAAIPALFLSVPVICIYIASFNIMHIIKKNLYNEENNRILQIQEEAFQEMLELMTKQEEKHSILRHDLRHYGNLIAACITNGQYEEALTGVTSLCDQIDKTSMDCSSKKYCLNPTVNTVITPLVEKAKSAGIEVSIQMSLPLALTVNVVELCIVLSNCIENAINACLLIPDPAQRKINLSIKKAGCQLFIEFKNTCAGPIDFDSNGLPITSVKYHGFGSRSIQAFVEKYNAILDFSTVEEGWFRISIIV